MDYEKEYNRLLAIFKRLDTIYQPHDRFHPHGLLDSPFSLIVHTRNAVDEGLGKEYTKENEEHFSSVVEDQAWAKTLGI